jgi:uncharacterized membrane protein YbaN (DUF454 family)
MKLRKAVVQLVGWMFLIVGIAGLFLPFLQGILFIFVGLVILSSQYQWAHKVLGHAKKRFPKMAEQLDRFLEKILKRFPSFNHEHPRGK